MNTNLSPLPHISRIVCLALAAAVLASPVCAGEAPGTWVNVTNNAGGEKWGYAGVCTMAAVPDSADVIAGISESGLWLSSDNGATWKKLGETGAPIKNRPHHIAFDPANPAIFWMSGSYGDAAFKTTDAGKTFTRLGSVSGADGISIDFSDPDRKTMAVGLHEQAQSVHLSADGGKSWKKVGANLPADSNFSSEPIVLDAKTLLVNASGWKGGAKPGIFRSEDAGQTWTSVSSDGPGGTPLLASDGAIYWRANGLLKSTDQGKTWSRISTAVQSNVIELPEKRLAGLAGSQVLVSADGGVKWTKVGSPAPFKPDGITYSAKGKCYYAWHLTEKKSTTSIARMNVE